MSRHDDPEGVISWIEEKAAQLTGLPVSHGEVRHPVTVTIAVHPWLSGSPACTRQVTDDVCVCHGLLAVLLSRGGLTGGAFLVQPFNVLRYQLGQHYDSHYDIFEPESYGPQSSQRVRSALQWSSVCLLNTLGWQSCWLPCHHAQLICSGVEEFFTCYV